MSPTRRLLRSRSASGLGVASGWPGTPPRLRRPRRPLSATGYNRFDDTTHPNTPETPSLLKKCRRHRRLHRRAACFIEPIDLHASDGATSQRAARGSLGLHSPPKTTTAIEPLDLSVLASDGPASQFNDTPMKSAEDLHDGSSLNDLDLPHAVDTPPVAQPTHSAINLDNFPTFEPSLPAPRKSEFQMLMQLDSVSGAGLSETEFLALFVKCNSCTMIMTRGTVAYHECKTAYSDWEGF